MSLTKMDTMKRLFLWVELALSDFLQISLKSDLYPFPQFFMKENDGDQERVKDKSEEKADEDWQVDISSERRGGSTPPPPLSHVK